MADSLTPLRTLLEERRIALFRNAIHRGTITLAEVDDALPESTVSRWERWMVLLSLALMRVEVRDARGGVLTLPHLRSPPPRPLERSAEPSTGRGDHRMDGPASESSHERAPPLA